MNLVNQQVDAMLLVSRIHAAGVLNEEMLVNLVELKWLFTDETGETWLCPSLVDRYTKLCMSDAN